MKPCICIKKHFADNSAEIRAVKPFSSSFFLVAICAAV